jgi:zinc protease
MRASTLPLLLILGAAPIAAPSLAGAPPPAAPPKNAAAPAAKAAAAPPSSSTPSSTPSPTPSSTGVRVALPIEKYKLDNGLEVILHEDHRTPVVAVNTWYHVGSKDEPPGKNGFAHLFEHVMFQGSKNVGEDMFFKFLERAGASDRNGTTNTDRTNYYETVPANELALVLWLESDRMGFLLDHADKATFDSQRDVVKNERRQNYENAPYGLVYSFIVAALYPKDHPYHLTTIGTPEDLDAASLDDVRGFFKTFYVPNNATLVVAGDIDKVRTKALIDKYYSPLPRGAEPPVKRTPLAVALSSEKRLNVEADVELPRVILSFPTPAQFAPWDAELDLLADVLSRGKSSRLYKRLVYDLQIAQDVSASQQSSMLASMFQVSVTLKKDKSPADVLKLVDEELSKLRKTPPSADEIERARTSQVSGLIFSLESVTARANLLNSYNQAVSDPGYLDKDLARYEAVKPEAVQKAAALFLPANKRIVTIVTPTRGAPRAGRLVGGNKG